jgi:RNA polymerase sigma-70 factor (family 1)
MDMLKVKQHTDKKLLKKLTKGDAAAFDQLYYRYAERVMGFAMTFFNRKEIAEEAVQEVFVRIWERRKELDPDKSFKAYLFQSVKFYMYNFIRDKKHGCKLTEVPEEMWAKARNGYDEMAFKELEEATFVLIEKLPQVQREVFKQIKLEGKSAGEIADKMNLSKRTIEHHLYLATKTLKLELLQHPSYLLFFYLLISL